MDLTNLNNTIIEKEVSDELIWITVSKYALFMSYGRIGIDAKSLYEHYQFTCIMQRSNSVWAGDKYCRQGLDWGRDRFESAKKLLIDLGLIEIKQTRIEGGKFGKIYIKVKMKRVELEPSDLDITCTSEPDTCLPDVGFPASGRTTTNALTNKRNALTNNKTSFDKSTEEKTLVKRSDLFELFWKNYGKPIGKQNTIKQWNKLTEGERIKLLDSLPIYTQARLDKQYRKDPERYIRDKIYEDFMKPPSPTNAFKEMPVAK